MIVIMGQTYNIIIGNNEQGFGFHSLQVPFPIFRDASFQAKA